MSIENDDADDDDNSICKLPRKKFPVSSIKKINDFNTAGFFFFYSILIYYEM